jgi:HPt (histidine-containing phosphotransfer) domain-containing protein
MKGSEKRCLDVGCTAFLTKPVVFETLMRTLRSVLDNETGGSQSAVVVSESLPTASNQHVLSELAKEPRTLSPVPKAAKSSPLTSSLPTDDEEFCEIVHLFVDRLNDKLAAMRKFFGDRNSSELAAHAHWLKGSGGMAGFDDFTEPARKLEMLAKNEQFDEIGDALQAICDLAQRIEPPQLQTIGSSHP